MRNLVIALFCGLFAGALFAPPAARADEVKRNIYVLGIHLGNADGVLFSLLNSNDQSKRAHPGATPLIRRQLKWSIDLAKAMGNPTASLEKFEKDLDKLEFLDMARRLKSVILEHQSFLVKKYNTQASSIFVLAIHQTGAAGVARHVIDYPRDQKPGSGKLIERNANWLKKNILESKLEANLSMAETLLAKVKGGASFREIYNYLDNDMRLKWQDEFLKAPAWPSTVAKASPVKAMPVNPGLAARPDLAVTITWDTRSDVDLWVTEPGGEKCYFGHRNTKNGGVLHEDNTSGFGPEHYTITKAPTGEYAITVHYYRAAGPTRVQIQVTRFAGTRNETTQNHTVTLQNRGDRIDVCRVRF